jgi:hypothetical protein
MRHLQCTLKHSEVSAIEVSWALALWAIGRLFLWQEMGFDWTGMFKLDEQVLNVARHTDATPTSCVVLFDVNTCKFVAGHVELDTMEILENIAEMVGVFKPNILHPKVINNETELDGTPFVVLEAWGGVGFVISFSKKAGLEENVGKNASLGKAISVLANFEVNPTSTLATFKFVLLNEFCQNVCNFNADTLRVRHRNIEVEVLELMELKRAPGQESTLLRSSLMCSWDTVLVPTSPDKQMQLPPMVMQVQSGSSFSGCTSHTTMVWQISFCSWTRMS